MQFEILYTPRLQLRKLTQEVYDYIYATYSDSEIKEFLGINHDQEMIKEKEKYGKGMSTYNRSFVNFQLLHITSAQVIGACGFHTWYPEHQRAEIGYALNADEHKQKGLMTEAFAAVIDYGFRNLQLNRIEALIGPTNTASLQLVKNAGFKQEGNLRQHYFKNNIMQDSLMFSLLKSEYTF